MFIRISDSGGRKHLRLVQAYRDEHGRTRQRQVAQLGRALQLPSHYHDPLLRALKSLKWRLWLGQHQRATRKLEDFLFTKRLAKNFQRWCPGFQHPSDFAAAA